MAKPSGGRELTVASRPKQAASQADDQFAHLARPGTCVPTLYAAGTGTPSFDHTCMVVLNALDNPEWDGRWRLDESDISALLRRIERDDGRLLFDDGKLHLEEIVDFGRKERNRKWVAQMPCSIHGILNETVVTDAFHAFDKDGSDSLDYNEWIDFVRVLEELHTQFLLRKAHCQFRAFFARGQPLQSKRRAGLLQRSDSQAEPLSRLSSGASGQKQTRVFQIGLDKDRAEGSWIIPPGWRDDLYYYSANNHPIHGIFACDPNHRLSGLERVGMELSTIGFSLYVATLKDSWVTEQKAPLEFLSNPMWFSIIIVTVPGLVIWQLLFFLFTCPKCGFVDKANAGRLEVKKARTWSGVGAAIGWFLLSLGLGYLIWEIVQELQDGKVDDIHSTTVIVGRLRGYMISWVLMLVLAFNPFFAWGQPDPAKGFNLGDYIGFGQWRIEKQRFQAFCLEHRDRMEEQLAERRNCIQPGCLTLC